MHWLLEQLDVYAPRSAACVRITSSFIPGHWGLHHIFFSSAPPVPRMKRNGLGSVTVTVPIMVPTGRPKDSLSITDRSSTLSISTTSTTLNPDPATEQESHSDAMSFYYSAKSVQWEMQGRSSSPPAGILATIPPTFSPPDLSDASGSTVVVHASSSVETV